MDESERKGRADTDVLEVEGKVVGVRGKIGFLRFKHPHFNNFETATFGSGRLYVNGAKVPTSRRNDSNFEGFVDSVLENTTLKAKVKLSSNKEGSHYVTSKGDDVYPGYFAQIVWVGNPPALSTNVNNTNSEGPVSNQEGHLVHRSFIGDLFISFRTKHDTEEVALAKNCSFYINGVSVPKRSWPSDSGSKISFDAVHSPKLPEYINIYKNGEGQFQKTHLKPVWTCTRAWIGEVPNGIAENTESSMDMENSNDESVILPSENEVTLTEANGKVVEMEGNNAIVVLEDTGMIGQLAFVSGEVITRHGQTIKRNLIGKLRLDDSLVLNLAPVHDRWYCSRNVQWMAVSGYQKNQEKRSDVYRTKIIKLDQPFDPKDGVSSGILQITGGPNFIGERVYLHRSQFYVFGALMGKGDLLYIVSLGDKVLAEIQPVTKEEYDQLFHDYGTTVKFKASMAFIGPQPKPWLFNGEFPSYVGNVIYPFLTKRGLDEEMFTKLIKGELSAKSVPNEVASSDLLPSNLVARPVELKEPDAPGLPCENAIVVIESGPLLHERAFFNRQILWCFGHHMDNADLMQILKETDRLNVEVQGGTNNKSVPLKVVSAWVGHNPCDPDAKSSASLDNPVFKRWLEAHGLTTVEEFHKLVQGSVKPKPFFPLPLEVQHARVAHIFPPSKNKQRFSEFGILRIHQGSLEKKDVLFARNSVYIWNVHFKGGDLSLVLKEAERVSCEVIEIIGKDKRKWQNRLDQQNIPKYCASLVYIGSRPKGQNHDFCTLPALNKNNNLKDWLTKRGISVEQFANILNNRIPVIKPTHRMQPVMETSPSPLQFSSYQTSADHLNQFPRHPSQPREQNNFLGPSTSLYKSSAFGDWSDNKLDFVHQRDRKPSGQPLEFENPAKNHPVMKTAQLLLAKAMSCSSPDDPLVGNIITTESEIPLALFLSKTLEKAATTFKKDNLGPIGPPKKFDPIETPQNEFTPDKSWTSRQIQPQSLITSQSTFRGNGSYMETAKPSMWESYEYSPWPTQKPPNIRIGRRESPQDFYSNEPPFKRRSSPYMRPW